MGFSESRPQQKKYLAPKASEMISKQNVLAYDNMWGLVMKAVPKLDESESGQMVLK